MSKDLRHFMENTPCALPTSWYIASPFSHEDPEIKIQREADAKRAEAFINDTYSGVRAYSPIAETADQERRGVVPQEGWYLYDFSELDKSDILVVLMLDGWENSIGVALEIAFALGKRIPIYYCTLQNVLSQENIPF